MYKKKEKLTYTNFHVTVRKKKTVGPLNWYTFNHYEFHSEFCLKLVVRLLLVIHGNKEKNYYVSLFLSSLSFIIFPAL